ncbi:EAL domain-containing protein [Marinicellulosiphila megalodicopiae]|uniref:EAL domain-containing protein n=1 Tax=Marinicellulosiphila megalodicopiae TaxID=2724896 RepID=UPI003BB106BE
MKILIVDDDPVDREHIYRNLKFSDSNMDIQESDDLNDALERIKTNEFDVVLLDYNLPPTNSLELILETKNNHAIATVPIISISNSSDESIALKCIQSGALDYLVKSEINSFRLHRSIINAKARFQLEQKLLTSFENAKELSEHDALTGLANRYMFDLTLKSNIQLHFRETKNLALLFLDLDHFKYINDEHGHDVGDVFLIEVVKRMNSCIRSNEFLARIGGDEFAITLTNLSDPQYANKVALRILDSLNDPIQIGELSLQASVSIGISVFPRDGNDSQDILKHADVAMYRSKSKGRNQLSFYAENMQEAFLQQYEMTNRLKNALVSDEFHLVYQPVIDMKSAGLVGAEALLRWSYDSNDISPDIFIPIAEKSKTINEIGQWVLDNALKQLSVWHKIDNSMFMSINLSPIQLSDQSLIPFIKACLDKYKINPEKIKLELTETALLLDNEKNLSMIQSLKKLGCLIALDDFGTGYSSVTHLYSFPIDTVKIDKSLMPTFSKHPDTLKVTKGLVAMINSLNLDITVEGVETTYDLNFCQGLNINNIQGFYYDQPLEPDAFKDKYLIKSKFHYLFSRHK